MIKTLSRSRETSCKLGEQQPLRRDEKVCHLLTRHVRDVLVEVSEVEVVEVVDDELLVTDVLVEVAVVAVEEVLVTDDVCVIVAVVLVELEV